MQRESERHPQLQIALALAATLPRDRRSRQHRDEFGRECHQNAMHPADQFDAFRSLVDEGMGVEEIAARFGVTATTVRQRFKLANVAPRLFELYRADEINLDQLMALAVTDDHAAQERVWVHARALSASRHISCGWADRPRFVPTRTRRVFNRSSKAGSAGIRETRDSCRRGERGRVEMG